MRLGSHALRLLALLVGSCLATSCGTALDEGGSGACPAPVPAGNAAALPRRLELDALGTVTEFVRRQDFVYATTITSGTLTELQRRLSGELRAAGYSVVGAENEVVEADVFFARGHHTTGGAKLIRTTGCDSRVRVQLFVSRVHRQGARRS